MGSILTWARLRRVKYDTFAEASLSRLYQTPLLRSFAEAVLRSVRSVQSKAAHVATHVHAACVCKAADSVGHRIR